MRKRTWDTNFYVSKKNYIEEKNDLKKLHNMDSSAVSPMKRKRFTWYTFVLDVSLSSRSLYKIRQAKLCLDRKEAFPEYLPKTLILSILSIISFISSVRSSNSHPDLLVITTTTTTPLFQITPVLNTGLSLSEPLQLYKGYNAI